MIVLPERYKLENALHGGGMSETLLCTDTHLSRKVVVKSLKPGIEPRRLLDELSALAAIRSKHVVQVLDIVRETNGSIAGFVEEHIDGGPLVAAPSSISTPGVIRLLYPIAMGIADIHAHNRVHRDIKPDNLRYDAEGTLKIFDFGLTKIDGSGGTTQLWFTHGYSAPEIFQKDASGKHTFTKSVDVFAFGATALWLLNGGNLPEGLLAVPPVLPCVDFNSLAIELPVTVAEMLNLCLDTDPIVRPSMTEVARLLGKSLLAGLHRMLLTHGNTEYRVDSNNPKVSLGANGANLQIQYNGLDFVVIAASGPVFINNIPVKVGQIMCGSAVIVFGMVSTTKLSVTADVSNPEVIL
jgi:eukaryotic-like serine/threonine-protein kinase